MNQTVLNQARSDKFLMVLDLPLELKNLYYLNDDKKNADAIQISVIGSPVPAITIPQIDMKYSGQSFHISSHVRPAYQPVNVNIIIDNHFLNYWILWTWLNKFNDQKNAIPSMSSIKDLTTKFTIYVLDEYHNRIMSFKYTDVFITGLSNLDFSYQNSELCTCTVTFAYSQMLVERIINSELDKTIGDVCLTS